MSIYTDEGVPMMAAIELAIRDTIEDVTTVPLGEDRIQVCRKPLRVPLCMIRPHGAFGVDIVTKSTVHYASPLSAIIARVRELAEATRETQLDLVIKDCTGIPGTVEEAPQPEPTLREFLVEFRRVVEMGRKHLAPPPWNSMLDWLDARLGKEESDG